MTEKSTSEISRINKEYNRRNSLDNNEYNLLFSPNVHLNRLVKDFTTCSFLKEHFPEGLQEIKILDVGCGHGEFLNLLRNMGALNENLYGIDLSQDRIKVGKSKYGGINFSVGSGGLPYEKSSFHLLTANTVFTSILDDSLRQIVAADMLSALKENGIILLYDFKYNNPKNEHVKALTFRDVKKIFPNCAIQRKSLTLAPPLSRYISRISFTLAFLMEKFLPFLRTHTIYCIQKK